MKKVILFVCLVLVVSAHAQLKNAEQLTGYISMNTTALTKALKGNYWKIESQGVADTKSYIRWMPANMTDKNMGEMVMCFYVKKDAPVDYVVYQTFNKLFFNKCKAGLLKSGYKLLGSDNKTNDKNEYYSNGVYDFKVTEGHQAEVNHVLYIMGVMKTVNKKKAGTDLKKQGTGPAKKK